MANSRSQPQGWKLPFFTIWSLQAISLLGSYLVGFALVWWLTESTGSATVLATATLVEMLPRVALGPFTGALVDRWDRRRVMIGADALIAVATAAVALLYGLDVIQLWHVYLLMFLRATAGGFHWSAMQASTSLMVPEKELSRIAGMNQTLQGVASIATPPLGALLLSLLPMQGLLAIDVVTALGAISPLLFIAIPQPTQISPEKNAFANLWRDVREGLRFIWGWQELSILLAVAAFANMLFNPAFSLMPILVTQHFGGGALQLGWLNSAFGVGMLTGGLALSAWGGFRRPIMTMIVGMTGMIAGVVIAGLAPSQAFFMGAIGIGMAGFMNPICNGPFFAILQSNVPAHMQGRVLTLVTSLTSIAAPLGMALAGPVSDWLGVRTWYLGTASVLVALAAALIRYPSLLNWDSCSEIAQAPSTAMTDMS